MVKLKSDEGFLVPIFGRNDQTRMDDIHVREFVRLNGAQSWSITYTLPGFKTVSHEVAGPMPTDLAQLQRAVRDAIRDDARDAANRGERSAPVLSWTCATPKVIIDPPTIDVEIDLRFIPENPR